MSEAFKSMPQQMQVVALPHMLQLMDLPDKDEIVKAVRAAAQQSTPEQIQAQIQQAVQDALTKAQVELKAREVAIKERKADAEVREIDARSVQIGVSAAYSAMQSGAQIAQMPQIAPIADVVMAGAGYQRPNPMGDDPNFPQPQGLAPVAAAQAPEVQANTSHLRPFTNTTARLYAD